MSKKTKVFVVETSDSVEFEKRCSELVEDGYRISSTNCGFVNSEVYDFLSIYQAILVLDES